MCRHCTWEFGPLTRCVVPSHAGSLIHVLGRATRNGRAPYRRVYPTFPTTIQARITLLSNVRHPCRDALQTWSPCNMTSSPSLTRIVRARSNQVMLIQHIWVGLTWFTWVGPLSFRPNLSCGPIWTNFANPAFMGRFRLCSWVGLYVIFTRRS